jgi:hypothetical protein
MKQLAPSFVRPVTTREDRQARVELGRRAGKHGKPVRQTRSNDRRKAIIESREAAGFLCPNE